MSNIVIGLDLSLNETGYAVGIRERYDINAKNFMRLIHSGTIPTDNVGVDRLLMIRERIRVLIEETANEHPGKEVVICLEGYAMGIGRAGRNFDIGELGGVIKVLLREMNLTAIVVPPTNLKKFIAGKGTAKKQLILKYLFTRFGFDTDNDNEADAIGLALLGLCKIAVPVPNWLNQKERDALLKCNTCFTSIRKRVRSTE